MHQLFEGKGDMKELFSIFTILTLSFVSPLSAEAPVKRKIGVCVGVTGNLASVGTGVRNAIILADRENDPDNRVEFIFEDDGFDAKRTAAAVRKLIGEDRVDGLIVLGSNTSLAVNGIAEDAKIPMIALGNSKKIFEGKKHVMMHFLNTDVENEVVVKEVKKRGFKRVAVIVSAHDAMIALSEAFKKDLPDRVAASFELNTGETDFRAEITKIKAINADAVYNVFLPGPAAIFPKQLRQMGFKGELFSAHAVDDWSQVQNAEGALYGTWFVTGNVVRDPGFAERYRAAFDELPKLATPNGYDSAKLFIEASASSDMNGFLHEVKDFHGIMGTYGLNPEGYFNLPAELRRITPQGFVAMEGS